MKTILYYLDDFVFENHDENVAITIFANVENDSFSHAFGTEVYPNHLEYSHYEIEDKEKYSEEEIKEIEEWVKNECDLEDVCFNYEFN